MVHEFDNGEDMNQQIVKQDHLQLFTSNQTLGGQSLNTRTFSIYIFATTIHQLLTIIRIYHNKIYTGYIDSR